MTGIPKIFKGRIKYNIRKSFAEIISKPMSGLNMQQMFQ